MPTLMSGGKRNNSMLRGLALAREAPETLSTFQSSLDSLISVFSARVVI